MLSAWWLQHAFRTAKTCCKFWALTLLACPPQVPRWLTVQAHTACLPASSSQERGRGGGPSSNFAAHRRHCSSSWRGRRFAMMHVAVQYMLRVIKVKQGSRKDSRTTRYSKSHRVSLRDGGEPRHWRVTYVFGWYKSKLSKDVLEHPQVLPNHYK